MEGLSLYEALATVGPRGVRHPLTAILSPTVVAILVGMKSLAAISPFGRDRGTAFTLALAFTRCKAPAKSCLSDLYVAEEGGVRADGLDGG